MCSKFYALLGNIVLLFIVYALKSASSLAIRCAINIIHIFMRGDRVLCVSVCVRAIYCTNKS